MRRSIKFCTWKALWWNSQHCLRLSVSAHVAEGITAYADEQAYIERQRAESWNAEWAEIREQAALVLEKYLGSDLDTAPPTHWYFADSC